MKMVYGDCTYSEENKKILPKYADIFFLRTSIKDDNLNNNKTSFAFIFTRELLKYLRPEGKTEINDC